MYYYSLWYRHSVNGRTVCRLRADCSPVTEMIFVKLGLVRHYVKGSVPNSTKIRKNELDLVPTQGVLGLISDNSEQGKEK